LHFYVDYARLSCWQRISSTYDEQLTKWKI